MRNILVLFKKYSQKSFILAFFLVLILPSLNLNVNHIQISHQNSVTSYSVNLDSNHFISDSKETLQRSFLPAGLAFSENKGQLQDSSIFFSFKTKMLTFYFGISAIRVMQLDVASNTVESYEIYFPGEGELCHFVFNPD